MRSLQPTLRIDTSERRPVYLLVGRDGSSYMRLSGSAHSLLQQVHSGASFASIAAAISQERGSNVSAAEVETAYLGLCQRIEAIEKRQSAPAGGFWLRQTLLPASLVSRVAGYLTWAFRPAYASLFLVAILAAIFWMGSHSLAASTSGLFTGYGLFLLSLLFHELGHAAACVHCRARCGEIGLTAYLIYPAFYSDVSGAWTLSRPQRVLVDLGGVYFQMIFGSMCVMINIFWPLEALRVCIVMIIGSCLLSMNPILKFDGYWILADALGITNLSQQPQRIYRYIFSRLHGKAQSALPWPTWITAIVIMHTIVASGFWLLFLERIVPSLLGYARQYPGIIASLLQHLGSAWTWPSWGLVQSFLVSTYMLLFLSMALARIVTNTLRFVTERGLKK